ncbi:MAG: chloride channel protein [bacterium]
MGVNVLTYPRRILFRIKEYFAVSEYAFIIAIACVVGILGGFGAVGLRTLITIFQGWLFGTPGIEMVIDVVSQLPWYKKLLFPTLGGLIVGPMCYFLAKEAKGHGVPDVMEAVALKGGAIRPRVVAVKSVATAVTIASGGSTGREGPIVQIGAALGSTVGQILKLPVDKLRVLVGCGAAAGIAATFNAPVAGAFFALEIILGHFAISAFSPIVLSSVLATVVSRAFYGSNPTFLVPEYSLVSIWEIPFYGVLGLLAGLTAVTFTVTLYKTEDLFDSIKIPDYLKASLGGLLIGCMLFFAPHIYGIGYDTINLTVTGQEVWYVLLILVFAKILATNITLGSGASGGVFAPSLFMGAVMAGALGFFLHQLFPTITAPSSAYALVGMGAVVAGTTHAPITAIIILFELTGDYKIILPVMIACTLSTIVAQKLKRDSIYTLKLSRRGISLHQGREETVMQTFTVGNVMRKEVPTIRESTPFDEIVRLFLDNYEPFYYVTDDEATLTGMVSIHDVKNVLHDQELRKLVIARDLATRKMTTVTPENSLAECMRRFGGLEHEELPVIESEGSPKLVGLISRKDIIDLYDSEILRKDVMVMKFVRQIEEQEQKHLVRLPSEYRIDFVPVPRTFIGKTLRELELRSKHRVTVLAVKSRTGDRAGETDVPDPTIALKAGDILVVVGKKDAVDELKGV